MEARLLGSLHHRLRQHELTIQATRRELLADFQQYYDGLLRGVPLHHAASIRSAITASFLSSYPTLRPELPPIDSPPSGDPRPAAFQPPSRPPASGSAVAPGSPREREHELQGLFTPTYLPLLDDFPTLPRPADPPAPGSPPGSSHSTPLPGMELQGTASDPAAADDKPGEQRVEYAASSDRPATPAQLFNVSTWPNSRAADDTRSSISSDKSDSKPTKSALRRSSSISKPPQSPRRVRFEFMGAEVLPTTSPQPSEFIAPRPPSPESDDDARFSSNLGGQVGEEEDEEAHAAPPRKVSSSDALRALSRAPLDEGTVWTVVNPDEDEAASDIPPPAPDAPVTKLDMGANSNPPTGLSGVRTENATKTEEDVSRNGSNETPNMADSDNDDDSSDDGFLAMAKTRKSKPLQTAVPTSPPAFKDSNSTSHIDDQAQKSDATAAAASDEEDDDDVEGDDMFFFEAGGLSAPPRPRPRPPLPDLEEDEATEESTTQDRDESDAQQADTDDAKTSLFATSPAVPIRHASRASPTVRFQPGSLGSYKGRPLMMPIVRDPEILAQANSVKESSLRVDGIDDEVAMAEGSPPPFPSTPLSFRGRFIMEEMMERARQEKAEKAANKTEGNA
ncbi:hypothetical protein PCL_07851 [Purpureocillium lilacinum]|uniref:Uncharacterized protein n=1 Tax=Purpureocillium lilacinum TaxID=33203 RepID=A0A2U3EJ54_PURLI|nr:hypothetical protein PCL_07851 [Purpureocillium lilacinum]